MRYELESKVHSLLCGHLSPAERQEVLERVATDDDARAVLRDMLTCQRDVHRAFGLDRAEAAMAGSLAELLAALRERGSISAAEHPAEAQRGTVRRVRRSAWAWRIAAGLAIAALVLAAFVAGRGNRRIHDRLGPVEQSVAQARITPAERADYRTIWQHVAAGAGQSKPWLLLTAEGGGFEYIPAGEGEQGDGRLVILRCLVVSPGGATVNRADFLLPKAPSIHLSSVDAGHLAEQPIRYGVRTEDRWVEVDLAVGAAGPGAVGLRGRAPLGQRPREVGQFHLEDEVYRVFLQALVVGGETGSGGDAGGRDGHRT